jgi:hypothetical protein
MKCITLWQPWASLILWGEKQIETRSWATQHRGLLAIHSAAKDHPTLAAICATEPFKSILARHGIREFRELPRRALLGTVTLEDCIRVELLPRGQPSPLEEAFGDYSPGRWGWLLSNATPLVVPVQLKGERGLFNINYDLLQCENTPGTHIRAAF